MNKRPFLHERSWSGGLNLWSIDFEVELIDFNTVSGKSHIIYGWDESELIFLYIITVSISDHEERRGGSEFQMIRTYRFRIYPDSAQIHILESSLNLSCELYNAMLQQRIYAYRSKKKVNYRSQQNEIPDIKKMFPEYKNMHSPPAGELRK